MKPSPWSPSQIPSRSVRRRIRLRKDFEDSVVAARFEDARSSQPNMFPARAPQPPLPEFRDPFVGTTPLSPDAAPALYTSTTFVERHSWIRVAGWTTVAIVAGIGAWAATIALARLVWKLSGNA